MRKLFDRLTPPALFVILLLVVSCKKVDLQKKADITSGSLLSFSPSNDIYSDSAFNPHDDDSIERMTVLGSQLPNPYLIPNMRQAYLDLGYDPNRATVTNLYVRFKPTIDQLAVLDSIMDAQGYDLFDTPMDYEVISEGDYYQDPSIPDSLPTWQYAVVSPNFTPPSGITYEVLAQIHIPPDDYTAVETEAENIAGGGLNSPAQANGSIQPYVPQCGTGYHWDYNLMKCVPNDCPPGYHWDNGQAKCVPNTCPSGYYWSDDAGGCVPYNTTPPPPAPDAQIPAGNITVSDINFGTTPGVRNTRVVAKRWFKIERGYTDNNGHFQFSKHFKSKVKINVKFKNDYSTIKVFRLNRFWQMLYPITKTIGIYKTNVNNANYNFQKYNTSVKDKGNLYWAAATTINAVQEYRDYATGEHFGLPPNNLKIFLTRYPYGQGMTPMWNKRWFSGLPQEVLFTFMVGEMFLPAAAVAAFADVVKHEVDMCISYKWEVDDYTNFHSDQLKVTVYHELTHAAHYKALGESWYGQFVDAEITEVVETFGGANRPYGNGSNSITSPIIALGESWAYHMGHYLDGLQYRNTSECAGEQDICYDNGEITGLNSHQIALENFNPNLTSDPFHWIPTGLFYDMMDARDDNTAVPWSGVSIDDQVSGYTNEQFFNAFSASTTTLSSYKTNLLQQNGNSQSAEINSLFTQYGY